MRVDDLKVLIYAAEHGSLSAAARVLAITPAVASVAIKRLEDALGTRLLVRSTRIAANHRWRALPCAR